jgi:uncharacterized damage-inducible protein DinB
MTTDIGLIRKQFEYDRWANARTLGVVAGISPEAFAKDLGSSFGSIRNTLVHIISAEWAWLERWNGTSPKQMLDPTGFPDIAALQTRWTQVERDQEAFLQSLSQERLDADLAYFNLQGEAVTLPLWQQMLHMVNHSSYHRGQVTAMLRQVGAKPIATDLIAFYREQAQKG